MSKTSTKSKNHKKRVATAETLSLSDKTRSVVTLLLVLHIFCVFVALSASVSPSALQTRVLAVLRPYTRLVNLEVPFAKFYLTYAGEPDTDHRLELLPPDASADDPSSWYVIPDVGLRGSDRYLRYQRLGEVVADFSDADEIASRVATDAAINYRERYGELPKTFRCRQHRLQRMDHVTDGTSVEQDPFSEAYFVTPYQADIIAFDDGTVVTHRRSAESQEAQPASEENR